GQSLSSRIAGAATAVGLVNASPATSPRKLQKGKGKAPMAALEAAAADVARRSFSKDLERGPDVLGHHNTGSHASLPSGIGPALDAAPSSSNSSIMGDADDANLG